MNDNGYDNIYNQKIFMNEGIIVRMQNKNKKSLIIIEI